MASVFCYIKVINLLPEREEIQLHNQYEEWYTALFNAAMYGCCRVVKRMIQQKDEYINLEDRDRKTPLTCTLVKDWEEIVTILQGTDNLNSQTHNKAS